MLYLLTLCKVHAYLFFLFILQLEECAIQLWNWAVTKNVGTSISKNQKAKGTVQM